MGAGQARRTFGKGTKDIRFCRPRRDRGLVSDLFDLSGKTALVTGSSRGIGRSIAEKMAELGAFVVVSSRKKDKCDEVVDAIAEKGGKATAIACNIGNKEELQALTEETRKRC